MECPYCRSKSKVTNSRSQNKSISVWRRRKCSGCQAIWSTSESIILDTSHKVLTDGKVTSFNRDRLFLSIYNCLPHRDNAVSDAQYLTTTVITKLLKDKKAKITNLKLSTITYDTLLAFDSLAGNLYKAKHKL